MGNEVSTVGGAAATAVTGLASGVTFGQIDALNDATAECAKFTADRASKTIVRHVGETVGTGVATAATGIAAAVTLGQVDSVNNAFVACAEHTADAATESGKVLVETGNGILNGVPVVGHIKGGIHYACGDIEGGNEAMKASTRTTGVIAGGAVGILGGPAGMVAGGITGGAVMDGAITGVESAARDEYTPSGSIRAWTKVVEAKDGQSVVEGLVDGIMTPVMDGVAGRMAGGTIKKLASNSSKVAAASGASGSAESAATGSTGGGFVPGGEGAAGGGNAMGSGGTGVSSGGPVGGTGPVAGTGPIGGSGGPLTGSGPIGGGGPISASGPLSAGSGPIPAQTSLSAGAAGSGPVSAPLGSGLPNGGINMPCGLEARMPMPGMGMDVGIGGGPQVMVAPPLVEPMPIPLVEHLPPPAPPIVVPQPPPPSVAVAPPVPVQAALQTTQHGSTNIVGTIAKGVGKQAAVETARQTACTCTGDSSDDRCDYCEPVVDLNDTSSDEEEEEEDDEGWIYFYTRSGDGNYKVGFTRDKERRKREHLAMIEPGTWKPWACKKPKAAERQIKDELEYARVRNPGNNGRRGHLSEIIDSSKVSKEEVFFVIEKAVRAFNSRSG